MADKSIKQIADYLGCPKIKVYKYIRAMHIEECSKNGTTMLYSEQVADRIIADLKSEIEEAEHSENALKHSEEQHENTLETVIGTLTAQLKVKDEQLAAKDRQIEQLTAALTAAQLTQQQLSDSLTAAQALHAGTIQQQLDDKSADKKQGFFARIFKRNT